MIEAAGTGGNMKLTRSVAYGVGILLQIKDAKGRGPVTAATIAQDCKFPPRFLYRVLRRLVDAGLLIGTSGPLGGYELARRSEGITLLDIVDAVESPPEPRCWNRCGPSIAGPSRWSIGSAGWTPNVFAAS